MTRARRDEHDDDDRPEEEASNHRSPDEGGSDAQRSTGQVSDDDRRAGQAIAAAAEAAGIAAPEPAETPLPPAVIGLRFVYSPGEVRLQYTTDAATWIEVPSFRFDEI